MHIYISAKKERKKQTNKMACAPSEDSDQPGHPLSESDQSFRCPHEESLDPYQPIERASKTMITLGG